MKTLIIPCAGRDMITDCPRYMMRHPDGRLIIEKSIESVLPVGVDRIVIAILLEDVKTYNAFKFLKDLLGAKYKVEVVVLPKLTDGPAETVYQTIKAANIEGPIVIKDVHNCYTLNNCEHSNFVAGLDLTEYERDIHNIRTKSFLILNEQKQVLDIVEKQFRSDIICVGMYGFKRASDYLYAYEKLNDKNYLIKKLYVSHIISYLIGYSGKVFNFIAAENYENWGSIQEWNETQRAYATYFLDADSIDLADIDVLAALNKLSERGAQFVAFTTKDTSVKAQMGEVFSKNNISCIEIVCRCSFSSVKILACNKKEIMQYKQEL